LGRLGLCCGVGVIGWFDGWFDEAGEGQQQHRITLALCACVRSLSLTLNVFVCASLLPHITGRQHAWCDQGHAGDPPGQTHPAAGLSWYRVCVRRGRGSSSTAQCNQGERCGCVLGAWRGVYAL
jgi:hypothetical protein